jgi:hypothetical protein
MIRIGRALGTRALVKPAKDADLTDEDRTTAAQNRDARIP